ncbi:MAG: HlyD family secretion protein [Solirubrobacterales bacterium]
MKKNRNVILGIIGIIIIAGVGTWYYLYWKNHNYFTTENSKVAADLYSVAASANGKLTKLNVSEGTSVKTNEVVARVENGPYVRSPINGEVVKCDVVENQTLAATSIIAVIADTENVYVNANIEETDISKIKVGQSVTVKLDAYPGRKFNAHVDRIDSVTQTALTGSATSYSTSGTYTKVTQLIPVKIVIDEDVDLSGIIGTNANVSIKLR